MIKPIPGQIIKDAWERLPYPMESPEYIVLLKIQELIAAYNQLELAAPAMRIVVCKHCAEKAENGEAIPLKEES